jgi:hypothetical protein
MADAKEDNPGPGHTTEGQRRAADRMDELRERRQPGRPNIHMPPAAQAGPDAAAAAASAAEENRVMDLFGKRFFAALKRRTNIDEATFDTLAVQQNDPILLAMLEGYGDGFDAYRNKEPGETLAPKTFSPDPRVQEAYITGYLMATDSDEHQAGDGKPFVIQSVQIKSAVGLDKAKQHAEHILRKKNIKVRQTKTMFRFRNLPKTKFVPGSYRSKKINKNITLTFGELKPDFVHLKGGGIFDYFKKGVERVKDLASTAVEKGKELVEKARKKVKDRGTTLLTGTHYSGPFNRTDEEYQRLHPPTDQIDRGALEHDLTYEKIAKSRDSGKISRTESDRQIRESDEKFLKNIRDNWRENPWASVLSYAGIKGKTLAEDYLGVDRNKFVTGDGRYRHRHRSLFTHPVPHMSIPHGLSMEIPIRLNGRGKAKEDHQRKALMRAIELISQRMDDIKLPATHPRSRLLNKEKQKMMSKMAKIGGKRKAYSLVPIQLSGKSGIILIRHPKGHMTGGGFFDDLWSGIKSVGNSVANWATDAYNTVADTVTNTWDGIKNAATNVYEQVKDTVSQGWNNLKETAQEAWDDLTSGAPEDEEEEEEEFEDEDLDLPEDEEEDSKEETKVESKIAEDTPYGRPQKEEKKEELSVMEPEPSAPVDVQANVPMKRTLAERVNINTNPELIQKMAAVTDANNFEGSGRKRGRPSKMASNDLIHIDFEKGSIPKGGNKAAGFMKAVLAGKNLAKPDDFKKYNQEGFDLFKMSKSTKNASRRKAPYATNLLVTPAPPEKHEKVYKDTAQNRKLGRVGQAYEVHTKNVKGTFIVPERPHVIVNAPQRRRGRKPRAA